MFGVDNSKRDGDPRVASALQELGMKGTSDDDGDFQFAMRLENGRTQRGFIRSETYEFMGLELREIFSFGLVSSGAFDARTCNILLEENARTKLGAWSVQRSRDDNHYAVYTAKISAGLRGKELLGTIVAILQTADKMEQRLSGRDDF